MELFVNAAVVVAISTFIVLIIVLIGNLFLNRQNEHLNSAPGGPSWNSVPTGFPVGYGAMPNTHSDAHSIRIWRTPIQQGAGSGMSQGDISGVRQVHDDAWARTYQPGRGFQLG